MTKAKAFHSHWSSQSRKKKASILHHYKNIKLIEAQANKWLMNRDVPPRSTLHFQLLRVNCARGGWIRMETFLFLGGLLASASVKLSFLCCWSVEAFLLSWHGGLRTDHLNICAPELLFPFVWQSVGTAGLRKGCTAAFLQLTLGMCHTPRSTTTVVMYR